MDRGSLFPRLPFVMMDRRAHRGPTLRLNPLPSLAKSASSCPSSGSLNSEASHPLRGLITSSALRSPFENSPCTIETIANGSAKHRTTFEVLRGENYTETLIIFTNFRSIVLKRCDKRSSFLDPILFAQLQLIDEMVDCRFVGICNGLVARWCISRSYRHSGSDIAQRRTQCAQRQEKISMRLICRHNHTLR